MAVLRSAALFLAGLLFATLLAEIGARLVELTPLWRVLPVAEVALYGPDPETGYDLRPNISGIWATENHARVATNALGLHDGPMTREKPAGVRRVVVVGDSITEALQVELEQTFVQVAERAFHERGQAVEMVNLGLSGATPAVVVQRLRHKGLPLAPDAALVMVSLDELLRSKPDDDSAFAGFVPDGHGGAVIGTAFRKSRGFALRSGPAGSVLYWLLDHSRVARIVNARKNAGLLQEWPQAAAPRPAPACTGERARSLLRRLTGNEPDFALARLRAYVGHLGESARLGNVPVAVVVRDLMPVCGDDPAVLRMVRDRLAEILAAEGLMLVDLDDEVNRRLAPGETTTDLSGFANRRGQGHLNPRGHAVFAQVLEDVSGQLLAGAGR